MRLAQVVPDVPAGDLEDAYTYSVPDGMSLTQGDAVLVPFGHRTIAGFVEQIREGEPPSDIRLRPVQDRIEGISLPENLLRLLDFLADEFAVTQGAALSAAIPPGIRTRLTTYYEYAKGEGETPSQEAILRALRQRGALSQRAVFAISGYSETGLKALVSTGKVTKRTALPPERKSANANYVVNDYSAVRKFISGEGKRKPAQAQCLSAMIESKSTGLTVAEISALTMVSDATVKAVIADGLLVPAPDNETRVTEPQINLNAGQVDTVKRISSAISEAKFHRFLLFGVTGSGKTEVYLRAIAKALEGGKQALFLVPEIALTAQVVSQLRSRFGTSVAVMHSGLATGERLRNWRRAANGEAPVVVGARSAIFAPLTKLGIIVLDEEHDGSYKQESSPRYDVRALAEKRAENENCILLCGSATPSINTFYRAENGEFELLRLPKRAAAEAMPEVHVEDLREAYKSKKPSMLSDRLRKELSANMQQREQSLLFINRRAFARSLLCRDCGFSPHCPNCSVALTYHMRPLSLRCHHCGFKEKPRDRCPSCGSLRIRPLGIGTQKVEEFVKSEFPAMRIARLDRDVASRKGAVDEIFARVRSGDVQTLIGTQMIAKGLDFENVTLVGVIAADVGLNIPDYRSTERTFQLITQVSGRAGRRKPGRVVVQSFAPDHPAIKLGAGQDYEAFYAEEIKEREDAQYPPFVRLANVIVSGPGREVVLMEAERAKELLENRLSDATIYGPAECVIARLHGNWRSHILVKLPLSFRMTELPRSREFEAGAGVNIVVDVDPGSLM